MCPDAQARKTEKRQHEHSDQHHHSELEKTEEDIVDDFTRPGTKRSSRYKPHTQRTAFIALPDHITGKRHDDQEHAENCPGGHIMLYGVHLRIKPLLAGE